MNTSHINNDIDENHRLLEEIMNSNITGSTYSNSNINNNSSTQNNSSNLASFLTDSSFLNIDSYPQLNSKNIVSSNHDSNINSNVDGITSENIQDIHEFLKFDINTLHDNINNNNNNHENTFPNHITPAQQHERLLYQKQLNDMNNTNNRNHSSCGNDIAPSFLDDMFTTSHLTHNTNITNNHNGVKNIDTSFLNDSRMIVPESLSKEYLHNSNNEFNSLHNMNINNPPFSTSVSNDNLSSSFQQPHSFNDPSMNPDFLFNTQHVNRINDSMLNYTDDIASSLSSSFTSDIMTPSSYSFNSQHFEPLSRIDSNSNMLSTSLKSPGTSITTPGSLRANTYLSQSLRQPTFMGTTPKSRHSSIANNNGNLDTLSTSVPKSLSHLTSEEKLRRKRDFHNAVERRRRELIKQKIKELGNLVPPSLLCFDANGKKIKPNKGIILNKTVEYINFLLGVLEAQDRKKSQLVSKIDELESMIGKLDIGNDEGVEKNKNVTDIHNLELKLGDINTSTKADNKNSSGIIYDEMHIKIQADNTLISDDLKQFLSGDVAETEDNAKLMFNHSEKKDPTEYSLRFDS